MTGFDLEAALAIVEGDRALLAAMARAFGKESPGRLAALREAVRLGDPAGVVVHAHALKGCLGSLGAVAAAEAAWRLEQLGRTGGTGGFAEAAAGLEYEFGRAQPYLAGLIAQGTQT